MSTDYHRTSLYWAEMARAIGEMFPSGVGVFTPHQLAEKMGRKVTGSQRNALAHAVELGWLKKMRYPTDRGGVGVAYEILPVEQTTYLTEEHPF